MIISDMSVKRPVLASVISLLIVVFGFVAFNKLPLREYPNIDRPVITIDTAYQGAAASVIESRITQPIEDQIAGVEGIKNIISGSEDGRSRISIEFNSSRDIDDATNDIRDKVSRVTKDLPDEISPPIITKASADDDAILWFSLVSDRLNLLELTDYANRYLIDQFSVINGVARIRIGGGLDYAMRIWLDRKALAARNVTVNDIEQALRRENVELPAGSIESVNSQFTVRLARQYTTQEQLSQLVIRKEGDYLVRLADIARIELSAKEDRKTFRGNGVPMVGIGITKQSTANTLEVARSAKKILAKVNHDLPAGMALLPSYDSSIFIEQSISEVYYTLFIAMFLVMFVIYIFLGDIRATLIPAITVPVSLLGTLVVLYSLGFTVNLLTLLAMILAIGMVVDDAIVMLENIHRRIENGEPPLAAAFLGARQVSFAVIATSAVLVSVFFPITFLEGDLGKLFTEFAVTMSAAVIFSAIVALSLSPMMCSKLLKKNHTNSQITMFVNSQLDNLRTRYTHFLTRQIKNPTSTFIVLFIAVAGCIGLFKLLPSEFTPEEDRGSFFVMVTAPEGSSFEYSKAYMNEIEKRLSPMVDDGEILRLLIRAPKGFGDSADFSGGLVIAVLNDWDKRRSANAIMNDVRKKLGGLAGIKAFPIMRQALGRGFGKPVQFVLGGSNYDELAKWRDIIMEHAAKNPKLVGLDNDYKTTKPQLLVEIDTQRAADLGVSAEEIGNTLAIVQGSRRVTTYIDKGEEYDVILEGERSQQSTPLDMDNIYVRSRQTNSLIPLASLISVKESADATTLNRYNRLRAITIEANLAEGYTQGEALDYLNDIVKNYLPAEAAISYKGQSQDFQSSGQSIYFIFILALIVVFLVLAAQFESFIHPFIIMLTVPLAILGAFIGLYVFKQSLNIYSQIGIIMLVGLAAKNGILIVEFANQLRAEGMPFDEAIINAAGQRLRPILMTAITTAFGTLPLAISTGAGAETRITIGIAVLTGIIAATFFTLIIVPAMYQLLAKNTGTPLALEKQLKDQLANKNEGRI